MSDVVAGSDGKENRLGRGYVATRDSGGRVADASLPETRSSHLPPEIGATQLGQHVVLSLPRDRKGRTQRGQHRETG